MPAAGGRLVARLVLIREQVVRPLAQVLCLVGLLFRLLGGFLRLVGPFACLVGGPLHPVGTFLRQPLLILVGPVLR
jgi:hypothetical protein